VPDTTLREAIAQSRSVLISGDPAANPDAVLTHVQQLAADLGVSPEIFVWVVRERDVATGGQVPVEAIRSAELVLVAVRTTDGPGKVVALKSKHTPTFEFELP
jgi:hypothetical protein